jgi:hypothetical protein
MEDVNRRSALALGIAASSAVVMTGHAAAQPFWPVQGREIANASWGFLAVRLLHEAAD